MIEDRDLRVYVAPADLLLALKLRAARLGRDDDDIAILVRLCDVRTDSEAQALLDRFYDREIELEREATAILEATHGVWTISTSIPPKGAGTRASSLGLTRFGRSRWTAISLPEGGCSPLRSEDSC